METEPAEPTSPDIAVDGDVVFLIGPKSKRVRVHSVVVRNASKVFAALLGAGFSEGQAVSAATEKSPAEISLPEDDAEALDIIFKVVHGRNDLFTKEPDSAMILKIAIATDKWDCRVPLAWAVTSWLKCDGITSSEQLWNLTLAAYWFDHQKGYSSTTRALIHHHVGSFLDLEIDVGGINSDDLRRIQYWLQERQASLKGVLMALIVKIGLECPHCDCLVRPLHCSRLMFAMKKHPDLLNLHSNTASLWRAFRATETIGDINRSIDTKDCEVEDEGHEHPDFGRKLREMVHDLENSEGLTLRYIRPEKSNKRKLCETDIDDGNEE